MKLPNPDKAIIDSQKLTGYCLNRSYPDEKHKARVFKSVLKLDVSNVDELRAFLLEPVARYDAIPEKQNQYGQKYIIDFPITRNEKTATIHSVWIVRNQEGFPRLVTCYVL